jgi:hypothetical protein
MQLDRVPLNKLDEDEFLVWHLRNIQKAVVLFVGKEASNLKIEIVVR